MLQLLAGDPVLLTSTFRTARCGPACRVVWEGSGLEWPAPIPFGGGRLPGGLGRSRSC